MEPTVTGSTGARRRGNLLVLEGGGSATAMRASLRLVEPAAPSGAMETPAESFLVTCVGTDGEASFAEVVRAVYNGDADPDDFVVQLVEAPGARRQIRDR
jgi:hypothetical protein